MEVLVCKTREKAVALTARIIEKRLRAKPASVLGMATGRTMEEVYTNLVQSGVSFAQTTTFNLDEYVGLLAEDPNSYASYMRHHLFDHVDIDLTKTHLPDGMAEDLRAAAQAYEAEITKAGGIDLQLLGIGETGHIGFNEPFSALRSRTRDKVLTPATRQQNAECFGGDINKVPVRAVTMGVETILEARELLLLACGSAKANMIAKAIEGPLCAAITASALQIHQNCVVVLDEQAAAELMQREYFDLVIANENKWDEYRDLI